MKNNVKINHTIIISTLLITTTVTSVFGQNMSSVNSNNLPIISNEYKFSNSLLENGITQLDNTEFVINLENTPTSIDGIVNTNNINLRANPSIHSNIVGQVNKGDIINVTGKHEEWIKVIFNDTEAYIYSEYIDVFPLHTLNEQIKIENASNPKYAVVQSNTGLNVRTSNSEESEVFTSVPNGTLLDVIEEKGEWTKVDINSNIGYVNSEFISVHEGEKPKQLSSQIVEYSKQFLGTPYAWGGTNLNVGVDCSGFIYRIMLDHGIELNRSSKDQIHNGYIISKDELIPGDLVFFGYMGSKTISHVGMYIGNNEFIHASSSSKTPFVKVDSLNEPYYVNNYISSARVLD